jgi:aminopeptidase N
VVSQHEDTEARNTFPCFDEPGFKVPWTLTIDAPATNVVVSNTPETSVSDVPGRAGWRRHAFARTKPLPSYLVALAVGPFDVVDGGAAGMNKTPLRYLGPKGRGADLRYAKEVTPRILELLEDYFGMPYPFEKLDSVTLPGNYSFGAMENVGLITYAQRLLLATPAQETERFKRGYVSVGAHEIAHMWFGDLVTLAWWDDVWLNEAFATWIATKTMYRFNPQWDTGESRARNRGSAIATDRLASARRVHNPVNNKEDLEGAFDSISYQKGAAVLEMFEAWLGPSEFRAGVREYLKRHAEGSATSDDFFAAIAAASGRGPDTLAAFRSFVDQSGVPLQDVELVCGKAPPALQVSQQRLRPKGSSAENREWTTPACFRYPGTTGDGRSRCEAITNAERSIPLADAPGCPAWVLGNAGGTGHYVVRHGPFLWKRLVKSATSLPVHEAAALLGDTQLLAESGLVPSSRPSSSPTRRSRTSRPSCSSWRCGFSRSFPMPGSIQPS